MEQFYAKTNENDLLRVTIENEKHPTSPREEKDELIGKMYVPDLINESDITENSVEISRLYDFFKQGLNKAGREDEAITIENEVDFNTSKGIEDATTKAYRVWKKDYCAAIPVFHYSHNSDTVRTNAELRNEIADGVIYASWDNPNVKEMLKTCTKEETQKWAEKQLESEINNYDCYLTYEVYKTTVECFNPHTMKWGEEPSIRHNIYPDRNVSYNKQYVRITKDALSEAGFLPGTYKTINAEVARKIIETPSAEYKNIMNKQENKQKARIVNGENYYAKTTEDDLLRVTLEKVENPVNPREDVDKAIGTMFLLGTNEEKDKCSGQQYKVESMYEFFSEQLREGNYGDEVAQIDEQVAAEAWGERKYNGNQIDNGVPYVPHNQNWGTRQLFDLWKKDTCAAVPIYHYNHEDKGEFIREARVWNKNDPIDGVMYMYWNDAQLKWHIEHEGKKMAQEWAEQKMRDEIYRYNCYLNKQTYKATVSVFSKYKMQWDDKPAMDDSIYPNHLISQGLGPQKNMVYSVLSKAGFRSDTVRIISEEEAQKIETTLSPEYTQVTGEKFIKDIKEALPQFNGNIEYAQRAIAMVYRHSNNKMQIAALNAYLKEHGCTSEEKTFAFVADKVGVKEQTPPQLRAGQAGCTPLVAKDRYNQTRGGKEALKTIKNKEKERGR